ncbi:MAG: endonuclease/exonuclease/phosphatase family protein [Actinomycetota bacterium]
MGPPSVGRLSRALIAVAVMVVVTSTTAYAFPLNATPRRTHTTKASALDAVATFTVAQFNSDIGDEYPNVDVTKVAAAILKSGAQVAGIEEGGASIPELAKDLAWPYYDVRMQIVSSLPLLDPPGGKGIYTFVEVSPGLVVALENVHMPSDHYGPTRVRNGATPQQVLRSERRSRLPSIRPSLRAAKELQRQGIPVFLMGDFNSPSFYDWTPATVGTRPFLRYPLKWPVSEAVVRAGFRDSYRSVYPDPVEHPGLTWPVYRQLPGWNPTPATPQDRIDFIYATSLATPTASVIVGEPGGPDISAVVKPFPSDHREIASTFEVTPVPPPTLVTVPQRLVVVGDDVPVSFHVDAGTTAQAVGVVPNGGDPSTDAIAQQPTLGAADGTSTFSSASWSPGAYQAVLVDTSGTSLSRFDFWVEAPGTEPSIGTAKATYAVGEPIDVTWSNAPGLRWDWVGVYKRGADPLVAYYLLYVYTHASIDGSTTLDTDSVVGTWPIPPGRYSVYLLEDDLYVKIAGAAFTVEG